MRVIEVSQLRYSTKPHFWSGRRRILDGIDLELESGEVFGFLGPNGAGKTTTIKAIIGLLKPDSGDIRVFGRPPTQSQVRRRLGFMPERAYFPEHLSARELLVAHAVLAGENYRDARARTEPVLERVGIVDVADERLGTYSKGMQQRVGLAQALLGDPDLFVLDEPMSGLDPVGRYEVRTLISELRMAGKAVFFSTHILSDVEAICDRVAIVVDGSVRRVESIGNLLSQTTADVEVLAEHCPPTAVNAARRTADVTVRGGCHVFRVGSQQAANSVVDLLRAQGAEIVSMQTRRRSLEEVFVAEAKKGTEGMR